jgi:3,4-dihydroxy-2-butanone 4-phosphate synthase
MVLNTIEELIEDIRQGKMVILMETKTAKMKAT